MFTGTIIRTLTITRITTPQFTTIAITHLITTTLITLIIIAGVTTIGIVLGNYQKVHGVYMKHFFGFVLAISICFSQTAGAADVKDIDKNIQELGFDRYFKEFKRSRPDHRVRIAILDYGFDGYEDEMNYTIPIQTIYKQKDQSKYRTTNHKHGLVMAQILTQYMTKDYSNWRFAPEVYLYKSD